MQALAELAVEQQRWEDAQQLVADHPELAETVCVPWAEWLVAKGDFHKARLAYRYFVTSLLLTLLQGWLPAQHGASLHSSATQSEAPFGTVTNTHMHAACRLQLLTSWGI